MNIESLLSLFCCCCCCGLFLRLVFVSWTKTKAPVLKVAFLESFSSVQTYSGYFFTIYKKFPEK